jgi:hypothetical protein
MQELSLNSALLSTGLLPLCLVYYQQGDGINLGRTPEPEMPSWLILCDGTLVTTEDTLFWEDLSISLALSPLTVHI